MSLKNNQTFRRTLKFVNVKDPDKRVTFNLSLQTNHPINDSILEDIENKINNLFLRDYLDKEDYDIIVEEEKERKKIMELEEKARKRELLENEKAEKNRLKEIEKQKKDENKRLKEQVKLRLG